jgi:hypothetical protein
VPAPDYFQPTVGWRVWLVVEEHGELRLASVMYPTVWEPRREEVAYCRPGDPHRHAHHTPGEQIASHAGPHLAPHVRCGCGIYASKGVELAASYFDGYGPTFDQPAFRVIGRVSLWGRVIEGDRGYRASHAYPSHLYVPGRSLNGGSDVSPEEVALAMTVYGVPVELLEGLTKRRVTDALVDRRAA